MSQKIVMTFVTINVQIPLMVLFFVEKKLTTQFQDQFQKNFLPATSLENFCTSTVFRMTLISFHRAGWYLWITCFLQKLGKIFIYPSEICLFFCD